MTRPTLAPLAQVCATLGRIDARTSRPISQVADVVSAFLDVSPLVSPAHAASSGSVRLLSRVVHRSLVDPSVPRVVRVYDFALALAAAIEADDLAMVEAVHGLYPYPLATPALSLAMAHGTLEMVQACAVTAFESIGNRDTFRVASYIITEVFLSSRNEALPTEVDRCRLVRYVKPALLQSSELVRWLDDKSFLPKSTIDELFLDSLTNSTPASAEIVQYLLESGFVPSNPVMFADAFIYASCQRNQDKLLEVVFSIPAFDSVRHNFSLSPFRRGGPRVLQWRQAFDSIRLKTSVMIVTYVTSFAIEYGNVDMVEALLHEHSVHLVTLPPKLRGSEDDYLAIVRLLDAANAMTFSIHTLDVAATNGFLDLVRWLYEHRSVDCSAHAMWGAAANGHLQVVQWLSEHIPEDWSSQALNQAASNGHIDIVQWLIKNRSLEWDANQSMVCAAVNGHLEVLVLLNYHGSNVCITCVTETVLTKANAYLSEEYDNLPPSFLYTLQWLDQHNKARAIGCRGECAKDDNHIEGICLSVLAMTCCDTLLLDYLQEYHRDLFAWPRVDHLDLVAWPPDDSVIALRTISQHGTLAGIQWLYDRHPECCDWRRLAEISDKFGRTWVSEWLAKATSAS